MVPTVVRGVRLLDPATATDRVTDVIVRDGRATPTDSDTATGLPAVDGHGCWLMPGIVDLAARLREPGATHKATMASELPAALRAGITTVCLPPDTDPVIDNPAIVARISMIAAAAHGARVAILGAVTQHLAGETLAEMSALKTAGCVGVSNAGRPLASARTARRALEYASGLGLTLHVQPLEPSLAQGGCAHDGAVALRLGLPPIPVAAETVALGQWIALAEETGAHIHFCRLSSARGVQLVRDAKARGLAITADVAAHQLFLTEEDVLGFDASCHVVPPLRSAADRDALRAGVVDSTLDALCSDHQPHEPDAKVNPFALTEPGMSTLETLLPLGLQLCDETPLAPLDLVRRLSTAPQAILGLSRPTQGCDWILVDPAASWRLDTTTLASRGHNTPFLGRLFKSRVLRIFSTSPTPL
ncbi:MAG: dihydroorotase [Nevskiaceae bacterium]|nr:MAG: dihydroorotase [Nevskiaceae bacterium]TBR74338.1 MAG: dihydroorotase [Nevskiaceae bacterium]